MKTYIQAFSATPVTGLVCETLNGVTTYFITTEDGQKLDVEKHIADRIDLELGAFYMEYPDGQKFVIPKDKFFVHARLFETESEQPKPDSQDAPKEEPKHEPAVTQLTFGQALEAMREGKKVARASWPMPVCCWLLPADTVKAEWCRDPHLKAQAEANGGEIYARAVMRQVMADGSVMTGWSPSQDGLVATDWLIVS